MKKVAIVGSTNFPLDAGIGSQIVDVVRDLGDDIAILTRGKTAAGEFSSSIDAFIFTLGVLLQRPCFTYPSEGGRENWVRDVEMVKDADEVIVLVSREDLERADRMTGSLHVAEKGLDQGKRVTMMTEDKGQLVWAAQS